MEIDPRQDSRQETSLEVKHLKNLEILQNSKEAIREFWDDRFDKLYLDVLEKSSEFGRHGVIAEIISRLVQAGRVLDAGCGTGILAELLDLNRFTYLGLDISEKALQLAKEKRGKTGATFLASSIEGWSPEVGFEVIVFNEVLYYLNYRHVLERARTWLSGPGLVVASMFDFKEGRVLKSWLENNMQLSTHITIENPARGFRWHVLAGSLK